MKTFIISLSIFLFIASANAQSYNTDPEQKIIKMTGPEPTVSFDKKLMLSLVNEARTKGCKCGDTYYNAVPPLAWNNKLEAAAALHSMDMYKNKYFSHTGTDGNNAAVRIENAGYPWKAYGENIGMGYDNEKQIVAGWIKSVEHCKNIMNSKYTEIGVGRAGNYWTQDFGAK